MTTICAVLDQEGGPTWIGSDGLCLSTGTKMPLPIGSKWAGAHGWAFGHAGNLRVGQYMRARRYELLRDLRGIDDLCDRVMQLWKDLDLTPDGDEGTKCYAQALVVCGPEHLDWPVWAVGPSCEWIPIRRGELWADGSGRAFALGAAHAIGDIVDSKTLIYSALSAAARYDDGSDEPIWVGRLTDISGGEPAG